MASSIKLRLQIPGSPDRVIAIDRPTVLIGRASDCDLILNSFGISRHHARLSYRNDGGWCVEDMGSKNGTRLNNSLLNGLHLVHHGDRIQLENIALVVLGGGDRDDAYPNHSSLHQAAAALPGPPSAIAAHLATTAHAHPPTAPPPFQPPYPPAPPTPTFPSPGGGVPNEATQLNVTAAPNPRQGAPTLSAMPDGKLRIARNARDLQQQWLDHRGETDPDRDRTIARLKDLVEIAKALTSAESSDAIFEQVQQVVFRYLTNIQRLALLVDIDETGRLRLLNAASRDDAKSQGLTLDGTWIGRSICQKVFREKIALQTADAQADNRFGEEKSILNKGIRSAMAVPLWNDDKVVGVLYADADLSAASWVEEGEEDLSFFSALANLVAASVQRWLLSQKLQQEERLCQKLERYLSPSVVQQMMATGAFEQGRIPPKDGEISILFADIVGFTALSERMRPAEVASLLNHFFEEMLQEIFDLGGTLDKFIGDCIMAFFGAPEPQERHADFAAQAACRMLDRLADLNARGGLSEPLQLRIAINSGRAVVGDVGSPQRMDYTVLGGSVNLASRMESICPPGRCVISEATYALLSDRAGWVPMGDYRFKGIERSITVYCNGPVDPALQKK
jgi:adenylate cyclase